MIIFNNMNNNKALTRFLYIGVFLLLLGGIFSLGLYLGYSKRPEIEKVTSVINKETQVETKADFNSFWKAWNVLNEKSIYKDEIKDEDRVWGAISGLASSFNDPYTVFLPPKENKSFAEEIRGSFEGIGAEIGIKDKVLTIISPLQNTPAWRAGLKAGDKIIKIDETITNDMRIDEAIDLIHGPKGTIVKITILRPGENDTREFDITRDTIQIPTLDTQLREDGIFVIKLYSFSENSDSLFRDALLEFVNSNTDKLILDLRGNPGGYLGSAVNIASWFVDEGKIILKESSRNGDKEKIYRSHGPRIFSDKLSLVVLVDGGSASSSEILAGALQDHKIATLIGEKTYGKGSVQELVKITEDTSLKVTVANWYTPEGISISLQGIMPDIEIPLSLSDFENKKDPQMDKAIQFLNK
jgi:carboxyl-terminal processing protease